jgi:hypothetical protein
MFNESISNIKESIHYEVLNNSIIYKGNINISK